MDSVRMAHHKLRHVLAAIKQRCYNPGTHGYRYYGGLGITVCPEWLANNKSQPFVEWALANGYRPGHSLTRNDKNLPYSPGNCKWVPDNESKRPRYDAQYVEHNGQRVFLASLVELYHPGYSQQLLRTIKSRINILGWEVEAAITTPINHQGPRSLKMARPHYSQI